ncbi:hypothetical protein EBU95_20165 [bacterium]|nr:hypothetical protein [bacterium]
MENEYSNSDKKTVFCKAMKKWKIPVTVTDDGMFVKANDIGTKLGLSNIRTAINHYGDKEKKVMATQTNKGMQNITYLSIIGVQRIVCSSRKANSFSMCKDLGLDCQLKLWPVECTYIDSIKKTFAGETMVEQFPVDNYRVDLYFPDYNIAIEIDEYHHASTRKEDLKRHNYIMNKLRCIMIRVCEGDCTYDLNNQIFMNIKDIIVQRQTPTQVSIEQLRTKQLELKYKITQLSTSVGSESGDNIQPVVSQSTEQTVSTEPVVSQSVLPLPELPKSINDIRQFYETWASTMKSAYKTHIDAHRYYRWKDVFGTDAKLMCQRFSYMKHFLNFVDNLPESEHERFFQTVYSFCESHQLVHSSFVKYVWRAVCVENSALQNEYKGMDTKLRDHLKKHNYSIECIPKQVHKKG